VVALVAGIWEVELAEVVLVVILADFSALEEVAELSPSSSDTFIS
jgi:hypothetical protein